MYLILPASEEGFTPGWLVLSTLKYVRLKKYVRSMHFWIKDRGVIRHCREPESALTLDQREREDKASLGMKPGGGWP